MCVCQLDAMLTRDRIPIVYHDFGLGVYTAPPPPASAGTAERSGSDEREAQGLDRVPVPVRNLTLQMIRNSKVGWAFGQPKKQHKNKSAAAAQDGKRELL